MSRSPHTDLLETYFADGTEAFLPQVSINCVVFRYVEARLEVLFHRLPGLAGWYLPGGYVRREESLTQAAYRNLHYAGIDDVFLRQIQTFGEVDRIQAWQDLPATGSPAVDAIMAWVSQRFITVVYYGLVGAQPAAIRPGGLLGETRWMTLDTLADIGLDHAHIARETQRLLATELLNRPVAAHLLPETFTLNRLRGLFEAILQRPIDRGTFRRKMLKLGILTPTDARQDAGGRPAHLYRFDRERYTRLLEQENQFGF